MALLFAGLYGLQCGFCIGKLSVFISVIQFEEIFSALIDSAVDIPDKLSSEDYFSLCVSDSSAEAKADTGIQMRANMDRAIVHAGTERSSIAGIEGDNNLGLQAQITLIKFINSKLGFNPTISPYKHLVPLFRKSGFQCTS